LKIVHEGRGGYIEIDARRYAIEHVEGGRFVVHLPSQKPAPDDHLAELEAFCAANPDAWRIERRR
jgi:hypothetical protein